MIKVLLVEDELLVRTGMKSLVDWNSHGFELAAEAAHGKEALDILESMDIDIVITDIRMPVMDGLELIEHIREREWACEIIVLSSYDDFQYVKKAMKHQVRDYIHKPTMTPQELLESMAKVTEQMTKRRSRESYQKLMLETVSESREWMLDKFVGHLLQGADWDSQYAGMLTGFFMVDKPFRAVLLHLLPMNAAGSDVSHQPVDKQRIQAAADRALGTKNERMAVFEADGDWLVLYLAEEPEALRLLTEQLRSQHGLGAVMAHAEEICTLQELGSTCAALRADLSRTLAEWKKQHELNHLIRKAIEFMHGHYMDNITLEKVSSVVHVSPVYLSRLFLKETGETFIDYLTAYRVEMAKQLLLRTDIPSYEVGERVGYRNSKYFLRVFKKQTGVTPGVFRDKSNKSTLPAKKDT